jgi:hypothetical protein
MKRKPKPSGSVHGFFTKNTKVSDFVNERSQKQAPSHAEVTLYSSPVCTMDAQIAPDHFKVFVGSVREAFSSDIKRLKTVFPELWDEKVEWDCSRDKITNPNGLIGRWKYTAKRIVQLNKIA